MQLNALPDIMSLANHRHPHTSPMTKNVNNVSRSTILGRRNSYVRFLVDEVFEVESKRLLNASERLNDSISRFALSTDQVNIVDETKSSEGNVFVVQFHNDACDKYLLEKMRLEDLREQVEQEKHEYETWKKRAVEVQSKPRMSR